MLRSDLSVSGPFVCRCLIIQSIPRLHTPLVEPGMRNSHTICDRAHMVQQFRDVRLEPAALDVELHVRSPALDPLIRPGFEHNGLRKLPVSAAPAKQLRRLCLKLLRSLHHTGSRLGDVQPHFAPISTQQHSWLLAGGLTGAGVGSRCRRVVNQHIVHSYTVDRGPI